MFFNRLGLFLRLTKLGVSLTIVIFRNKWPSFFRDMWHGCRMGEANHQALTVSRSALDGSVLWAMLG